MGENAASVPAQQVFGITGEHQQLVHGTCVALNGRAALILGPSGAGKSALALQLMGFGADLVADDQVIVTRQANALIATCPAPLHGLIEARGIGILRAHAVSQAEIALIVDLSQVESSRLPPRRSRMLLDVPIDLVLELKASHFAASVLHYIKVGRAE